MNVSELVREFCSQGDRECSGKVADLVAIVGLAGAERLLVQVRDRSEELQSGGVQHKSLPDAELRRLGDRLADKLRRPAPARKVKVKLKPKSRYEALKSASRTKRAGEPDDHVPPFIGAMRSEPREPDELPAIIRDLRREVRKAKQADAAPADYRGWLARWGAIPDD